jgi:diacylglycerol O-acyltransferase/trehalose O-mycolyltransferase
MFMRKRGLAACILTTLLALLLGPQAAADGGAARLPYAQVPAAPNDSYLASVETQGPRNITLNVYSASMGRAIPVEVILPADRSAPRPVLYLLNGAEGGEDGATWQARTDVNEFFADKDVYVVNPIGGAYSYYTDWERDDPELGRNKWQTFLTQELPPVVDAALGANGRNAIAGLSMSATSVLNLAIAAPGLYQAVGSYSGCAQVSDPVGEEFVRTVVERRGGGDATNMWGPYGGPGWQANDPYLNAARLRGTALYISTGPGTPGVHESPTSPRNGGDEDPLATRIIAGGTLEAATNYCTRNFQRRLAEVGVPATFAFRPAGTHSWGYWEDDLHNSWPLLGAAIGAL